jgi:Receptor L domain
MTLSTLILPTVTEARRRRRLRPGPNTSNNMSDRVLAVLFVMLALLAWQCGTVLLQSKLFRIGATSDSDCHRHYDTKSCSTMITTRPSSGCLGLVLFVDAQLRDFEEATLDHNYGPYFRRAYNAGRTPGDVFTSVVRTFYSNDDNSEPNYQVERVDGDTKLTLKSKQYQALFALDDGKVQMEGIDHFGSGATEQYAGLELNIDIGTTDSAVEDDIIGFVFGVKDDAELSSANADFFYLYWKKAFQDDDANDGCSSPAGIHLYHVKGDVSGTFPEPFFEPCSVESRGLQVTEIEHFSEPGVTWEHSTGYQVRMILSPFYIYVKVVLSGSNIYSKNMFFYEDAFPSSVEYGIMDVTGFAPMVVSMNDGTGAKFTIRDADTIAHVPEWYTQDLSSAGWITDASFISGGASVMLWDQNPRYATINGRNYVLAVLADTAVDFNTDLAGTGNFTMLSTRFNLKVTGSDTDDVVGFVIGSSTADELHGDNADFLMVYIKLAEAQTQTSSGRVAPTGLHVVRVRGTTQGHRANTFFWIQAGSVADNTDPQIDFLFSDTDFVLAHDEIHLIEIDAGPTYFGMKVDGATACEVNLQEGRGGGIIQPGFAIYSSYLSSEVQVSNLRYLPELPETVREEIHSGAFDVFKPCTKPNGDAECGSDYDCEPTQHVCLLRVGTRCSTSEEDSGYYFACMPQYECRQGQCSVPLLEACTSNFECGDGRSCDQNEHICYHNPRLLGEPCIDGVQDHKCENAESLRTCGVTHIMGSDRCGCPFDQVAVESDDTTTCSTCTGHPGACENGECTNGVCMCYQGYVKTASGVCQAATDNAYCVHGARDAHNLCSCDAGYTYDPLYGGCTACADGYVQNGSIPIHEPQGQCIVSQTCAFSNLIPGCDILSDEGDADADNHRTLTLRSLTAAASQADRDLYAALLRIKEIRGTMTITVELDNDDTGVFALVKASQTTLTLKGSDASSAGIKWRWPALVEVKSFILEQSSIVVLPATSFPILRQCNDLLKIRDNALLKSFSLPRLQLTPKVWISLNPILSVLHLPVLRIVESNVRIYGQTLPALSPPFLPSLDSTGYVIVSSQSPSQPQSGDVAAASTSLWHVNVIDLVSEAFPSLTKLDQPLLGNDEQATSASFWYDPNDADLPAWVSGVNKIQVQHSARLLWAAIPGARAFSGSVYVEVDTCEQLELIYDMSAQTNSVSQPASSFTTLEVHGTNSFHSFVTCSSFQQLTLTDTAKRSMCCSTRAQLVGNSTILQAAYPEDTCSNDCAFDYECDAVTNTLVPIECSTIQPPLGPLKCDAYTGTVLQFDNSNPLAGNSEALAFLNGLVSATKIVIQHQDDIDGTLDFPLLKTVQQLDVRANPKLKQVRAPALARTTGSFSRVIRIRDNQALQKVSFPVMCNSSTSNAYVVFRDNPKLVFSPDDICSPKLSAVQLPELRMLGNPQSLGSIAHMDALLEKFQLTATSTDEFSGNGGCIIPEPQCTALHYSQSESLEFSPTPTADQFNLSDADIATFLNGVVEIRATITAIFMHDWRRTLPSLRRVYGRLSLREIGGSIESGPVSLAGFAPALEAIDTKLYIRDSPNLVSFEGAFNSLRSLGSLRLRNLPQLNDGLRGLRSVRSIADYIHLGNCDVLQSLEGLLSVVSSSADPTMQYLYVRQLDQLQSLHGLEHIRLQSNGVIDVSNNDVLNDISALQLAMSSLPTTATTVEVDNNPQLQDLTLLKRFPSLNALQTDGNGACLHINPGCRVYQGATPSDHEVFEVPGSVPNTVAAADVTALTRIETHVLFDNANYNFPVLSTIQGNVQFLSSSETAANRMPELKHVFGSLLAKSSAATAQSQFDATLHSASNPSGVFVTRGAVFVDDSAVVGTTLSVNPSNAAFVQTHVFETSRSFHSSIVLDGASDGFTLPSAASPTIINGSLHIVNNFTDAQMQSIDVLSDITHIDGSLVIAHTQLSQLPPMPNLRFVGGSITIANNPHLSSTANAFAQNAATIEIGGDIVIRNNPTLNDLTLLSQLPIGETLQGRLVIADNAALVSLNPLSEVVDVVGDIVLRNNPLLVNWSGLDQAFRTRDARDKQLRAAADVASLSRTVISGNGECTSPMPGCTVFHGDVTIDVGQYVRDAPYYDTAPLPAFFASLKHIDGSMHIIGANGELDSEPATTMPNVRVLEKVSGSLFFTNCSSSAECFAAFAGPPLFVDGDVRIAACKTPSLAGLGRLQAIGGSLHVADMPNLYSLLAFNETARIGGNVQILRNAKLASLKWLASIESVGGNVTAQDNPSLSDLTLSPKRSNADILSSSSTVSASGSKACTEIVNAADNSNVPCTVYQGADLIVQTRASATSDFWSSIEHIQANVTFTGTVTLPRAATTLASISGSLVITGSRVASSPTFGRALERIDGHLEMTGTVDFFFTPGDGFASLTRVSGSLNIEENANLESLLFRSLEHVGQSIALLSNAALLSLEGLSSLRHIGASLLIVDNAQLSTIDHLESVSSFGHGSLVIQGNTILTSLSGVPGPTAAITIPGKFTRVSGVLTGSLIIRNNAALAQLDSRAGGLSLLDHVDGAVEIVNNPLLEEIDDSLARLRVVAMHVRIERNPLITSLSGLSNLLWTGMGLFVEDNAGLTSLLGLETLMLTGFHNPDAGSAYTDALVIRNNPSLTDLQPLQRSRARYVGPIQAAGHVIVANNSKLGTLSNVFSSRKLSFTASAAETEITTGEFPMFVAGIIRVSGNAVCREPEAGCTHIETSKLRLTSQSLAEFGMFWPNVRTIRAELEVMVDATLPNLVSVDALTLTASSSTFASASFPVLETVAGDLVVSSNPTITTIPSAAFAALRGVGGVIRIQDNPLLSDATGLLARFVDLGTHNPIHLHVQGNAFECFSLTENDNCQLLMSVGGVDDVIRVDSSEVTRPMWQTVMYIVGNTRIATSSAASFDAPTAPNLIGVQGLLTFGNGVRSVGGMNSIRSVTSITVERTARLVNLDGLTSLSTVRDSIDVVAGSSMRALFTSSYQGCHHIGADLRVAAAEAHTSFTTLQVPALKHVGGSLMLSGAMTVTNIELPSLQHLGSIDLEALPALATVHLGNVQSLTGSARVNSCNSMSSLSWLADVLGSSVSGNLIIENNTVLASLSDFSMVNSVTSEVRVASNPALRSLQGLHNIHTIVGGLHLSGSGISDLAGMRSLSSLGGFLHLENTGLRTLDNSFAPELSGDAFELRIVSNPILVSLIANATDGSSTAAVLSLRSDSLVKLVKIRDNGALESLVGLGFLTHVVDLDIQDCTSLETLDGLQNLVTVDVLVRVQNNANLVHLEALLQNFDTSSFVGLVFDGNKPCSTPIVGCEVYAGPEPLIMDLSENGGPDSRDIPLDFWVNIREIQTSVIFEGSGPFHGASLPSAPQLHTISGDLTIRNGIADLSGLRALTEIGGDLSIVSNGLLSSLVDLANITTVAGSILIEDNEVLQSFNALSPSEIGTTGSEDVVPDASSHVTISLNPVLESLHPLFDKANSGTIYGSLHIRGNSALSSLSALSTITSIGGSLEISNNPELTDLSGLDSIMEVKSGKITLLDNTGLTNVDHFNWAIASGDEVDLEFASNGVCVLPQSGCKVLLPRGPMDNDMLLNYDSADFAKVGISYSLDRRIEPRKLQSLGLCNDTSITSCEYWNCDNMGAEKVELGDGIACSMPCPPGMKAHNVRGVSVCVSDCIAPAVPHPTDPLRCVESVDLVVSHSVADKAEFWAAVNTIQMNVHVPMDYSANFSVPLLTHIEGDLIIEHDGIVAAITARAISQPGWALFPEVVAVTGRLLITGQSGTQLDLRHIAPKLAHIGMLQLLDNAVQGVVDLAVLEGSVSVGSIVIRNTPVSQLFQVAPLSANRGMLQSLHISNARDFSDLSSLKAVKGVLYDFVLASTGVSALEDVAHFSQFGSHQMVLHDNTQLSDLAGVTEKVPAQHLLTSLFHGGPAICSAPASDCQAMTNPQQATLTSASAEGFAASVVSVTRGHIVVSCGASKPWYGSENDKHVLFIPDNAPASLGAPQGTAISQGVTGKEEESLISQGFSDETSRTTWTDPAYAHVFREYRESHEPFSYQIPVTEGRRYTPCLLVMETASTVYTHGQREIKVSVSTKLGGSAPEEVRVLDMFDMVHEQKEIPERFCLSTVATTTAWVTVTFEVGVNSSEPVRLHGFELLLESASSSLTIPELDATPAFTKLRVVDVPLVFNIGQGAPDSSAYGPQFPALEWGQDITIVESCSNIIAPAVDFHNLKFVGELSINMFLRGHFAYFNALQHARSISISAQHPNGAVISSAATDIAGFQSLKSISGSLEFSSNFAACPSAPADRNSSLRSIAGFRALAGIHQNLSFTAPDGIGFRALNTLGGFASLQSIGGALHADKLPLVSWEGLQQLSYIGGSVEFDEDTKAARVLGLGQLTDLNSPESGKLTLEFFGNDYPSANLACPALGYDAQPKWNDGALPHADGAGIDNGEFYDRTKDADGYLFGLGSRAALLGPGIKVHNDGCEGDENTVAQADSHWSWTSVANTLGRNVIPGEILKFIVFPYDEREVNSATATDFGLEATQFIPVPYIGQVRISVSTVVVRPADVDTSDDGSEDAEKLDNGGGGAGVPDISVHLCWSIHEDGTDCEAVAGDFTLESRTDDDGSLVVPNDKFYFEVPQSVVHGSRRVYIFSHAHTDDGRLLDCGSAVGASPRQSVCRHHLDIPREFDPAVPHVTAIDFADTEAVVLAGRVSFRKTKEHTKSKLRGCPVNGAQLSIKGSIAQANTIESTSGEDGAFLLVLSSLSSTQGQAFYHGQVHIKLAGRKFALVSSDDPDGDTLFTLSKDGYTQYHSDSDYLQLKATASNPGEPDTLVIDFRLRVAARGVFDLHFADVTQHSVVTINAQQGLCDRVPLSSSRWTDFVFAGGAAPASEDTSGSQADDDGESSPPPISSCPDFEYRFSLGPSRVAAAVPLPPIPIVSYVAAAPTAPQQAYFDFMGTQSLALYDAEQAPFSTTWIFRSTPQIKVEVLQAKTIDASGSCSSVLDEDETLVYVEEAEPLADGETEAGGDPNIELIVTVIEEYGDNSCDNVPGAFSMIDSLSAIQKTNSSEATDSKKGCMDYIEQKKVVPGGTPCELVTTSGNWPLNIQLRAAKPAAASPSHKDPHQFMYPVGVSLAFQAADAQIVQGPTGPSIKVTDPVQRTPRQTATFALRNVLVQGKFELSKEFSTLLPRQHPLLFLYKPPGDLSYSKLSKGTVITTEYSASKESVSGGHFESQLALGVYGDADGCVGLGASLCKNLLDFEAVVGPYFERTRSRGVSFGGSFTVETEITETIQTGSEFPNQDTTTYDPRFHSNNGDLDVFIGLGTTVPFSKSRLVEFNRDACQVDVTDQIELEEVDDVANTLEFQQIYDIRYRILPELEGMKKLFGENPDQGTDKDIDEVNTAIDDWKTILKEHNHRRERFFENSDSESESDDEPANFWRGASEQLLGAFRSAQARQHLPPFLVISPGPSNHHVVEDTSYMSTHFKYDSSAFVSSETLYSKNLMWFLHRDSTQPSGTGATDHHIYRASDHNVAKSDRVAIDQGFRTLEQSVQTLLRNMHTGRPGNYSDTAVQAAQERAAQLNTVSFSGGGHTIEREYTASTTSHNERGQSWGKERQVGIFAKGIKKFKVFKLEGEGRIGEHREVALESAIQHDESSPLTVEYVLGDDDLGDTYDVRIHEDPYSGMPVFETLSGRSSCPNNKGTVPREVVKVLQNKFVVYDADPEEPVVIRVPIVNSSPTDEMFPYVIVQNATTNQKGLKFQAFGQSITEEFIPVYLLPHEITLVEFQIDRPAKEEPEYYDFEGASIVVMSPCDWHRVFDIFTVDIHYMKPCPPIEWVGALTNDWTNARQGLSEVSVATSVSGLLIVPPDGLVLSVRNPHWQLAAWKDETQLEAAEVQARRVGTQEWITVSGNLKEEPETNWGEVIVRNTWPNQAPDPSQFPDGLYELRGITKCKTAAGIRSDHLKYSVTAVKRVIVGNRYDPFEALRDDIVQQIDASLAAIKADVNASRVENEQALAAMQVALAASHDAIETKVDASLSTMRQDIDSSQSAIEAKVDASLSTMRQDINSSRLMNEQALATMETALAASHDSIESKVDATLDTLRADINSSHSITGVSLVSLQNDIEAHVSQAHQSSTAHVDSSLSNLRSALAAAHDTIRSDIRATNDTSSLTLEAVNSIEAALDAFESGASTSHSNIHSELQTLSSSLATLASDLGSGQQSLHDAVNASQHVLSSTMSAQLMDMSARMDSIIVNNSAIVCALDADISALNTTVDGLTDGTCSLRSTESSSSSASSESIESQSVERRNSNRAIVCDSSHSIACCGNGILEFGEFCDTASDSPSEGCVACSVTTGWSCQGSVGAASTCVKVVPGVPITVTFGASGSAPSLGLGNSDATVGAAFPADLLPSGEFVNVSFPTADLKPGKVEKGTYLRIDASATPNFDSNPMVIEMQFNARSNSDKCTFLKSYHLRLFDTDLQSWKNAADTCSGDMYLRKADTTLCTLTTHVCHLTDFAIFDDAVGGDDADSGLFAEAGTSTWVIGGAAAVVIIAAISAIALVLIRRRRRHGMVNKRQLPYMSTANLNIEAIELGESASAPAMVDAGLRTLRGGTQSGAPAATSSRPNTAASTAVAVAAVSTEATDEVASPFDIEVLGPSLSSPRLKLDAASTAAESDAGSVLESGMQTAPFQSERLHSAELPNSSSFESAAARDPNEPM